MAKRSFSFLDWTANSPTEANLGDLTNSNSGPTIEGDNASAVLLLAATTSPTLESVNTVNSNLEAEPAAKRQKTNVIAKIFDGKYYVVVTHENDDISASCKNCGKTIKGSVKSTGIFLTHIKRVHPQVYDECKTYLTSSVPVAATESKQTRLSLFPPALSAQTVKALILNFIIQEALPFDTVNKESFKELLRQISHGRITLPSTPSLMSAMNDQFDRIKANLKSLLKASQFVCTTADVWSCRGVSFLGMTVHLIDKKRERKSFVLAFRKLSKKQSYDYLAKIMFSIHQEFGLNVSKITHTVTDGGSNICKAFRQFAGPNQSAIINVEDDDIDDEIDCDEEIDVELIETIGNIYNEELELGLFVEEMQSNIMDFQQMSTVNVSGGSTIALEDSSHHQSDINISSLSDSEVVLPNQMRCFSHLLNLVSSSDFNKELKIIAGGANTSKAFSSAVAKLQRFWNLSRRSSLVKDMCLNTCGCIFPVPNTTRWNSKFDAIRKILDTGKDKVTNLFEKVINEIKPKNFLRLKQTDWQVLTDYVSCMTPVAQSLDILQGDKNVSIGYVLPTLFMTRRKLQRIAFISVHGENIRRATLGGLKKRFENIMKFEDENKELILAAVSNPKFKLCWIPNESPSDKEFVRSLFVNECITQHDLTFQDTQNQSSEISQTEDDFFRDFFTAQTNPQSTANIPSIEALGYLDSKIKSTDVLASFKIVEFIYRKYNTSLPASAAVERMFSQALLIFTPRRNRLSPKNFERVLFIKHNRI